MKPVLAKKICMLGSFSVGKTSLVRRFVESIFSDSYLTTIGVKISKKVVETDTKNVSLMIWDIEGVDVFTSLKPSNLRGAAGVLLVMDGTRQKSIEVAEEIFESLRELLPGIPVLCLLNKSDLEHEWKVDSKDFLKLEKMGTPILHTSAKTGENVEKAFLDLVEKMDLV